ncbi:DUF805 domain-containing protein [Magnetovibrio sp.]|uniref:DUF805 domain-containing protein n=1 Tax=Magnetovibrio sp. TaxID=2024836 RepID=UPI002F9404F6
MGAQQAPEQMAQLETMASMIELGMLVFFVLLFGAILLIARRNMKGWDQPLSWVWFSLSGRLNRKAYWLKGVLLMSLIGFGVQMFGVLIGLLSGTSGLGAILGASAALLVLLPLLVFNFWVSLAISVKRAHDLGHSGWWLLLFLVPIYNLWMAIVMGFFRGTPGPNDYGPDPIDPINDYIDEMTGGAQDDGDGQASAPSHPNPRPPQGGDDAPQGFGGRKFAKPEAPAETQPEADFTPVDLSGGADNLDVIKRRLGDDIMRPIKRKGGGGREPVG